MNALLGALGRAYHEQPLLTFRLLGQLVIAAIALLIPAIGPNRFLLAGILLLGAIPLSALMRLKLRSPQLLWGEPLFELVLVVLLVHLVPQWWFAALCIGLMVALAPSVSMHPRSLQVYAGFAALLVSGMAFAAWMHDVAGWEIPLLAVTLVYPAVLYYAYWQVRHLSELRERAQRMQSLTELSGNVAHDFNNVLMGISGHAELAQLALPDDHPARRSLEEVIRGTDRASLLCGQLLAFSGHGVSSQQPLDLSEEIRTVVDLLRPVVPSGVQIELELPDSPCVIFADRAQLQQVVMNVVINAGEALDDISEPIRVSVVPASGGRTHCLEVVDHGRGISGQALERVFDPFYTTKERGHGLGLASVERIMTAHGGRILITSEPLVGTVVRLSWPKYEAELVTSDEPLPVVPASRRGSVLLVDDELAVLEATRGLLEQSGYRVFTASDATVAERTFRENPGIDAVILDLKMPGRDGWACLRELRAIDASIPIVICSGFDPQPRSQELGLPLVATLQKPFRIADLEKALETLRQGSRQGLSADPPVQQSAG